MPTGSVGVCGFGYGRKVSEERSKGIVGVELYILCRVGVIGTVGS